MSELTSKPMFSFNEVQEELANLREQIAQEIEHDENDSSPFPCGCMRKAANIARGK